MLGLVHPAAGAWGAARTQGQEEQEDQATGQRRVGSGKGGHTATTLGAPNHPWGARQLGVAGEFTLHPPPCHVSPSAKWIALYTTTMQCLRDCEAPGFCSDGVGLAMGAI